MEIDFKRESKQRDLFIRHKDVIIKINEYNKENRHLNITTLSSEMGLTKQRVSVIIEELCENQLILKEPRKEWQEKGGKSQFLFITPISSFLIEQSKIIPDKEKYLPDQIKDIEKYINIYYEGTNSVVQVRALKNIRDIIIETYNKYPSWKPTSSLEEFFKDQLKKLLLLSKEISKEILLIIKRLYYHNYYNKDNITLFNEYIKSFDLSENPLEYPNVLNSIIEILIISIKNIPQTNSIHYKTFIRVLTKYKRYPYGKFRCIIDVKKYIYEFPENIKEDLENKCFEILNSIEVENVENQNLWIGMFLDLLNEED